MKVTLKVFGREMIFSENELVAILENHLSNTTNQKSKNKKNVNCCTVNLKSINRDLFVTPREDEDQEKVRKLIQEAFSEADSKPEKYSQAFETLVPDIDVLCYTKSKLIVLAYDLGDHMADWVEQALEWAQKISDGQSWESICNYPDTSKNRRMIIWKNGNYATVGNYHDNIGICSASQIGLWGEIKEYNEDFVSHIIPLIVNSL